MEIATKLPRMSILLPIIASEKSKPKWRTLRFNNLIWTGLNFGSRKLPGNKSRIATRKSNEDFDFICSIIYKNIFVAFMHSTLQEQFMK